MSRRRKAKLGTNFEIFRVVVVFFYYLLKAFSNQIDPDRIPKTNVV
jgi:hypothetical protein